MASGPVHVTPSALRYATVLAALYDESLGHAMARALPSGPTAIPMTSTGNVPDVGVQCSPSVERRNWLWPLNERTARSPCGPSASAPGVRPVCVLLVQDSPSVETQTAPIPKPP